MNLVNGGRRKLRQLRWLAAFVTAVLALSSVQAVAYAAPASFHRAKPVLGKPVPVKPAKPMAAGGPSASSQSVAPATALASGTSLVVLPASGATPSVAGLRTFVTTGRSKAPGAHVSGAWRAAGVGLSVAAATSTAAKASDSVAEVSVSVLSPTQTRQRGLTGPAIQVARADGRDASASVALRISASALAATFGADYASRVRWVQVPASNSTSAAGLAQAPSVPQAFDSTAGGGLVLTPQLNGAAQLLVPLGSPTSPSGTGSFAATPLKSSSSWQVSAQTGDFSWSYPMRVPPAPAGPAPSVALSYDSQSIDGETGSTNNQPSEVGEGWSVAGGGSISRVYTPCSSVDGSAITGSGDLCWGADNATVSFAGHSGPLVKNSDGTWKLGGDDSTRVEYLTGASNGTYDGDYWRLTTTDGTKYYFGLNRLPGWASGNPTTNSAWTVPVCGTAATACSGTSTTAAPMNVEAWQWNLDYVVDPHGNAESFYYAQDTNAYAEHGSGAVSYVRGGTLSEIDYGLRSGSLFAATSASAKVKFGYTARCETGAPAGACSLTTPTASYWPDVPWDQHCTTASCTQKSPSFWSTEMLSTVTTQVLSAGAYANVDVWTLGHSWPAPGDGTSAALWLTQVAHTGYSGAASIATPVTVFHGTTMQNRVWAVDGLAPLDKWRITSINTDSGATTVVTYSAQQCTPAMIPALTASPQTNTNRCFPAWWTPQVTPPQQAQLDWFHKYVVTSVVNSPVTGGADYDPAQVSTYLYTGSPAWRFDQSPGTPDNQRSWSTWAGYSKVEIRTGDPNSPAQQHTTDYTFFQGLDGDPDGTLTHPTSSTRAVTLTASDGTAVPDSLWWAGRVLEQVTRLGSSGGTSTSTTSVLSDTITVPWASTATASNTRTYSYTDPVSGTVYTGTLTAASYLTDDGTTTKSAPVSTGGNRTETVTRSHDGYGRVTQVEDATSDAGTTCTKTSYATNTTSWLLDFPAEVTEVGVACDVTPTYPDDAVSATASYYDGSTTLGAAPTTGNVTQTAVAASYSSGGTPTWRITATSGYDALGRVTSVTDPRTSPPALTTTAYTPAAGGPVTQTVVTNPNGWTTTTTFLPAWGVQASTTDVNCNLTSVNYDALGRVSQVWLPSRPKATYPTTPSTSYAYTLSTTAPETIATTSINASGSATTSYALYDGLGQVRQTQSPAEGGGIDIVDTSTDANGQTTLVSAPYYATGTASATLLIPSLTLPSETQSVYDGAGRVTASILLGNNVEVWRTSTSYLGADRVDTIPPTGGTPTSTYTNSRGKNTKLVQYLSAGISGSTETTSYGYDLRGDMTAMTDPAGHAWNWTFDVLGENTKAVDPDTGTTLTSYDVDGNIHTTTDANGNSLTYSYDNLNRKVGEYAGTSTTGVQLAGWTYDTATAGHGLAATATRYVGGTAGIAGSGTAYSTSTTAYSPLGAPAAQSVTIGGTTSVAGTYSTSLYYDTDGSPSAIVDPAEGGLPSETLRFGYDTLGQQVGLSSASGAALGGVIYTHLGQVAQTTQAMTGTTVYNTDSWDPAAERLSEHFTQHVATAGAVVSDYYYTYNNAGEVLEDNNVTPTTSTDTQCYTYDQLQNLTAAWTPASNSCAAAPSSSALGGPAPYWTSYGVDQASGNRTSVVQHAGTAAGADTRDTYTYPTSGYLTGGVGGPNAVATVQHATAPAGSGTYANTALDSYTYNASGSTLTLPGQSLAYDTENHVASTTLTSGANSGQSQSDIYDASGNLLLQSDPVTGTTAFLGDTELHVAAGSTAVTGTRTYSALGTAMAERDTTVGVAGSKLYFLDTTPQGSAIALVDTSSGAVTRRYVDPFGNPRGAAPAWTSVNGYLNKPTNPFTTGSGAAITQLGAREYDSSIGRFLSVDPLLETGDQQATNG